MKPNLLPLHANPDHVQARRGLQGRGFTLVEVMFVVSLLAMLSAILVGGAYAAIRYGKDSRTRTTLTTLDKIVDEYFHETGHYFDYRAPAGDLSAFIFHAYGRDPQGADATGQIDKFFKAMGRSFVAPSGSATPDGRLLDGWNETIQYYNPDRGDYNGAAAYRVGDRVRVNGSSPAPPRFYRCIQNNGPPAQPVANALFWVVTNAEPMRPWFWSLGANQTNQSGTTGNPVGGDDIPSASNKP